jgi:3-methyladenine DNA glycosylase AlkC
MQISLEELKEIFDKVLTEVKVKKCCSESDNILLSRDPKTPPKTLQALATDVNPDVRYFVAQNPNTPTKVLEQLATDENWRVRCGVAHNPNTSTKTLEQLATDEDSYVRWSVARNPNYNPKETLEVTKQQKEALKKLIDASQDESLKTINL